MSDFKKDIQVEPSKEFSRPLVTPKGKVIDRSAYKYIIDNSKSSLDLGVECANEDRKPTEEEAQ